MNEKLSTVNKIENALEALDRLAENPKGRARCGYIWILSEILEELKNDVLILEEKIKMEEKGEENNGCQESDRNEEN